MNTNLQEELRDLEQEVQETEKMVERDIESLRESEKYLNISKVQHAEAIIRLNNFKKANNL